MLEILTNMVAVVGTIAAVCLLYVVKEIYNTNKGGFR